MNPFFWYTPAETKIPFRVFRQSLRGSASDAEQTICSATGSAYCLFGPSGRVLLYALLTTLKQKSKGRRDEVLIPGYTCYSVPAAVVKAGLKIRFYDLDPETLSPVGSSIKKNSNPKTLAIISQHLFGIPIDLKDIGTIASESGAYHIEDAAQAFGCQDNHKAVGTTGDFGLFSFGRGKPLPLGGGGALVSNLHNVNQLIPAFGVNGDWTPLIIGIITQFAAQPALYGLAEMLPLGLGRTIYDPRFNTGDNAAPLSKLFKPMMGTLPSLNKHRKFVAAIYRDKLQSHQQIDIPESKDPIFQRFPVLAKRGRIPIELRRLGVRRLYPNALHKEAAIAINAINPEHKMPGAEVLAQRLITLPTHHGISGTTAELIARRVIRWTA